MEEGQKVGHVGCFLAGDWWRRAEVKSPKWDHEGVHVQCPKKVKLDTCRK